MIIFEGSSLYTDIDKVQLTDIFKPFEFAEINF